MICKHCGGSVEYVVKGPLVRERQSTYMVPKCMTCGAFNSQIDTGAENADQSED
jgi:uncharacterized Zn finger protein